MALRERISSLCDLSGALPVEEARELLRGVTGDIECEIEPDGSFRLSGALNFAAMLNAPGLTTGGVRHSLVAGARFAGMLRWHGRLGIESPASLASPRTTALQAWGHVASRGGSQSRVCSARGRHRQAFDADGWHADSGA